VTTPLLPGQLGLHDRAQSQLQPGTYTLEVGQTVSDAAATLAEIAPSTAQFSIVDPGAATLPATEVLAVYPPAGAQDAVDVMLPHIVLRSRSLPWANAAVVGAETPWVALLLFVKEDEVEFSKGVDGREQVKTVCSRFRDIMPQRSELARLCHVRELPTDDPIAAKDDDRFVAIVVGNRLPRADATNTACLVDLRGCAAANIWPDSPVAADVHALPVLHRWDFEVSSGGDFEAYFKRLREGTDGAGGVVAFGSASDGQAITNDSGALELVDARPAATTPTLRYAGPCVPLPLGLIDAPAADPADLYSVTADGHHVVTYSAAFELGRLLALANPRVLDALLVFRDAQFHRNVEIVLHTPIPGFPKPPGPDFRESWRDIFNDTNDWMGGTIDTLWKRSADPTGIMPLVGQIPGLGFGQLRTSVSTSFTRRLQDVGPNVDIGVAIDPTIIAPDLGGVDIFHPDAGTIFNDRFAELTASIASIGIDLGSKELGG